MRRFLLVLLVAVAAARCGEGFVDSNGNTILAPAPDAGCDGGEVLPDGGCDEPRDH